MGRELRDENQGQGPGEDSGHSLPIREQITIIPLVPAKEVRRLVYELNNPEDGWNRIGSFLLPADSVTVQLSNQTDGRRVIADAVKWVRKR